MNQDETTTALTVRLGEIAFPEGVETLGEKANYLHRCSVEYSKKSAGAAILAGWVLSVARSTCAHGQWLGWLEQNVSFTQKTANNYLTLYAQTLGARRATARRPIALNVEPTAEELEAAAHDVDGKALSALYKSTRLVATSENWGGKRVGAGHPKKNEGEAEAAELDAIANNPALLYAAIKDPLDAIWKLHSERDVFHRLGVDEFREVATTIFELNGICSKVIRSRGIKG